MQKWWKGFLLMAGAASAATAGGTAYFYRRVMKRNRMKVEDTMKMSGTDWSRYADLLKERKAWDRRRKEACHLPAWLYQPGNERLCGII